jgi:proline utilization trans-activator
LEHSYIGLKVLTIKAKFGFFDLDATFSAGFIMLLAAIIESTNNTRGHHLSFLKPSPGILESLQLLDFLAGYHNEAAKARRDQIQRLYDHIPALVESLQIETGSGGNGQLPFDSSGSQAAQTPHPTRANTSSRHPSSHMHAWDPESGRDMMDSYTASLQMPFPSDAQTMYSLYQGDDFVLTGADMADFEELQRHLLGSDIGF